MRYARQVAVGGVAAAGQSAIRAAKVRVFGCGLAADVAARYLAGAGVGELIVPPELAAGAAAINGEIAVAASDPRAGGSGEAGGAGDADGEVEVEVAGRRFRPRPGDAVLMGSQAARWALLSILARREDGA